MEHFWSTSKTEPFASDHHTVDRNKKPPPGWLRFQLVRHKIVTEVSIVARDRADV